jgi:diphthamide biosynthesis protein 2
VLRSNNCKNRVRSVGGVDERNCIINETMSNSRAPQLLFDDGSRVIQQQAPLAVAEVPKGSSRGSDISISSFYEIDRLASEIIDLMHRKASFHDVENEEKADNRSEEWFARVALQFPDDLLSDSPEVCWEMEVALLRLQKSDNANKRQSLVFCLGDTTFGPCCPDEVAALHLNADVLVHFGHACLSHPPLSLPVLYSFGISHFNTQACVDAIMTQATSEGKRRLLLLYQVRYSAAIEELQTQLSEQGDMFIVTGQIHHEPIENFLKVTNEQKPSDKSCCKGTKNCPTVNPGLESNSEKLENSKTTEQSALASEYFRIGGLEVPRELDFSSFTVVFIGDPASDGRSEGLRQYMNTVLWSLSARSRPSGFWTYSPVTCTLDTSIPSGIQRQLNRRFYLIQKARDASIYGILIGTLSQRHFRSVVHTLQEAIREAGRSSYTFAMGKVNPAKIANFAEIECFIMVACAETSWLEEGEQREMHVPIITPLELHMALGSGGPEVQWGACDYSLDYNDFLDHRQHVGANSFIAASEDNKQDAIVVSEEEDAPYYSLVTGKYESGRKSNATDGIDLTALPGKGQLTTYRSDAAEFLKKREYKGLEVKAGETETHKAVPGQQGIASKYNNDRNQEDKR